MLVKFVLQASLNVKGEKHIYEACKLVKHAFYFKRKDKGETFDMLKKPFDGSLDHVFIYFSVNNTNTEAQELGLGT